MVEVYRKEAHCLNVVFSETAFNYAKAVSCLRLIIIARVSDKCHLSHAWVCLCLHVRVCVCVCVCVCLSVCNSE